MRTTRIDFYINCINFLLLPFYLMIIWRFDVLPISLAFYFLNCFIFSYFFQNAEIYQHLWSVMRVTFSVTRDCNTNFFVLYSFFYVYTNHDHTMIKIILRLSLGLTEPVMDFYNGVEEKFEHHERRVFIATLKIISYFCFHRRSIIKRTEISIWLKTWN